MIDELLNEQVDDNIYTTMVSLELYKSYRSSSDDSWFDYETADEVEVTYSIEFEHRSWGIKDISINIEKPISFSYSVLDSNNDEIFHREITLPPGSIGIAYENGSRIAPDSLSVYLREDGTAKSAELYVDLITG